MRSCALIRALRFDLTLDSCVTADPANDKVLTSSADGAGDGQACSVSEKRLAGQGPHSGRYRRREAKPSRSQQISPDGGARPYNAQTAKSSHDVRIPSGLSATRRELPFHGRKPEVAIAPPNFRMVPDSLGGTQGQPLSEWGAHPIPGWIVIRMGTATPFRIHHLADQTEQRTLATRS